MLGPPNVQTVNLDDWKCTTLDANGIPISNVEGLTGDFEVTMNDGVSDPIISVDIDETG